MAEVQTNTQTGELSQRFVEFVMMQAQNAALFLGQIPNPKTGEGEVNLELAKLFIDQLAMIQEKTRGNLTNEEATVLRNAISNLQMAYVEVAENVSKGGAKLSPAGPEQPAQAQTSSPAAEEKPAESISTPPESESESKKKFSKSYGS
jgi:type II secretory pathway component HofQ